MTADQLFYWVVVPLFKIVPLILVFFPVTVAFLTYAERKLIADVQVRMGPRRVGPAGIAQPIADVMKLLFKEDITPSKANWVVFLIAPILAVIPAFLVVAVFPLGPDIPDWSGYLLFAPLAWIGTAMGADLSRPMPMGITDLDIGLLFILSVSSLGVFAILLAGWASNSKYPLLGGLRSAAQLISYEIPLGFALIAGLMMTGTMSMYGIIEAQRDMGCVLFFFQPISFFIYFIAGVAETNRVPFDLPEAETELVSGFHTEYSGMKFALFFLAEYINMITVTVIAVTMFLGGWLPLGHILWAPLGWDSGALSFLYHPLLAPFWLGFKVAGLYLFYFWLRATLPRYRYDQLMDLGWKWLIPLSILNLGAVGVVTYLRSAYQLGALPTVGLAVLSVIAMLTIIHVWRWLRGIQDGKPSLRTAQ